jgi:GTPase
MLFRRQPANPSKPADPPRAPGPNEVLPSEIALPEPGPTRFDIEASFHLTGLGEVIGGTVVSGTVRVGGTYRLFRPPGTDPAPFGVQVHRIVWRERPNPRVILYRGQYLHRLEFAGPGQRVSVGIRGVPKGTVMKGDYLAD